MLLTEKRNDWNTDLSARNRKLYERIHVKQISRGKQLVFTCDIAFVAGLIQSVQKTLNGVEEGKAWMREEEHDEEVASSKKKTN